MSSLPPRSMRKLRPREWRMLIYLAILACVAAWRLIPRPWNPTTHRETGHYTIASTATPQQTTAMGDAAERQYRSYERLFSKLPKYQAKHPKLKMLLYKDRDEMRRINPGMGWAEAFYQKPYCRAFYSAGEANPYHWMLHEAVHQLNEEVAHLELEKWLEEGLAEYLSTSRVLDGELRPGRIDRYTYPAWLISAIAKEGDGVVWAHGEKGITKGIASDLANGSLIPLRAIIENNGPNLDDHVDLYYLHWWTLAHFVFEKHPGEALKLLAAGGTLHAFERLIGPVEIVQSQWYQHILTLRHNLRNAPQGFEETGELSSPWIMP